MYKKTRSWKNFSSVLAMYGLIVLAMDLLLIYQHGIPEKEGLIICIVIGLIGVLIFLGGLKLFVWDYKKRHKYYPKKVDKSLNYTFYLTTGNGRIRVIDFEQIKSAMSALNTSQRGSVLVEMEPPMGGVKSFYNEYHADDDYFYTYVLNERFDGDGYFILVSDTLQAALDDLKRLFFKHKQIDVSYYNEKETGWQA